MKGTIRKKTGFSKLTLEQFYTPIFHETKTIFNQIKNNYVNEQQHFQSRKNYIVKEMENRLVKDGYLKKDSNRKQDIIATFISRCPEDNKILQLFHQEARNENVFSYYKFIREFNFLEHFLDKLLKEFLIFEGIPVKDGISEVSFFEYISGDLIKQMFDSKFGFDEYISSYFENYLKKLEKKRTGIFDTINSGESGKKMNLTKKLLSLFDGDVEEKLLQFTKAYVIAKY